MPEILLLFHKVKVLFFSQYSSVRSRMEREEGMNLTEFTYQIFQAYDWLYLQKHHGCSFQVG